MPIRLITRIPLSADVAILVDLYLVQTQIQLRIIISPTHHQDCSLAFDGGFRLYSLHIGVINLLVDDDFIYEDEEEEEPDIDVENGYYNAKGILR